MLLARFKDPFFKTPFRDGLFFLPTFFLSFHAPSEFMSHFFYGTQQ